MLHLAPRLQAAQDQRIATGIDGPDLTRITRFAALLPADQLDQQDDLALDLFTLRDERLPPFYLERLLHNLERSDGPGSPPTYGAPPGPLSPGHTCGIAQQRASLLLNAARDSLLPLQWQAAPSPLFPPAAAKAGRKGGLPWPFGKSRKDADENERAGHPEDSSTASPAADPPTRRHAFRAALQAGDSIAHLFASNIIDPIRADTHVPGDPFVQTTLYVIAPLYEPLTSALIWPTIAHQLNYLGQRHIAQVVGIFATGSYATDSSRIIEDASCYATLAELEALSGLRPAQLNKFVSSFREDAAERGQKGPPFPEERLGHPLFDRIYLVDREKSNQGLARNSYELSVLVANTLQSLIAADGAAYIDEQVGIDLRNASQRPYSLLGAAADYVPLDYIFRAAQQEEAKRLVREQILLQPGDTDNAPGQRELAAAPLASLHELSVTSQQALAQLVEQMPDLFDDLNPQSIRQLSTHSDYLLPPATARKLRGLNPVRWQAAFDLHFHSVQAHFEEDIGPDALDTAWGLAALRGENGLLRNPGDNRLLPTIARQMRSILVTQLSSQPTGLLQARRQLHHWLLQLQQERHALILSDDPPPDADTGGLDSWREQSRQPTIEHQLELRDWRARYLHTLADHPSLLGSLTRAFGLLSGIVLLTLSYLFGSELFDNMPQIIDSGANPAILMQLVNGAFWDAVIDFLGNEANAATCIGLMIGAFLGATFSFRARASRVQQLRRERVNLARSQLNARLQDSVRRGLGRVHDRVEQMLHQMDHIFEETYETLQTWSVSNDMPPLPPQDAFTSHLYRPHLNPTLWQRCQAFMQRPQRPPTLDNPYALSGDPTRSSQARAPQSDNQQLETIREGRLRESWTSPYQRETLDALFHDQPSRPLAKTLSSYIRENAQAAATDTHLGGPSHEETETARLQFVRSLAQDYSLERLLWRDTADAQGFASLYPDGEFTPVSTSTLNYLESMWNAAKPSANYDVSDRMAAYGLPVEFAAVSGGPDSDLTESVMQGLRIPRLLTGNPFQIAFVRTLHGLELKDLGSMSRYLAALGRMKPSARQQVLLTEAIDAELYNQQP